RHGHRTRVLPLVGQRRHRRALVIAVLAGTAVTALFVTAPWNNSPGFLERAQAALTPAGWILHARWIDRDTSKVLGCTITARMEVWVDRTPPHRFRAVMPAPPPVNPGYASKAELRSLLCHVPNRRIEVGGTNDIGVPNAETTQLMFVPPNTL